MADAVYHPPLAPARIPSPAIAPVDEFADNTLTLTESRVLRCALVEMFPLGSLRFWFHRHDYHATVTWRGAVYPFHARTVFQLIAQLQDFNESCDVRATEAA